MTIMAPLRPFTSSPPPSSEAPPLDAASRLEAVREREAARRKRRALLLKPLTAPPRLLRPSSRHLSGSLQAGALFLGRGAIFLLMHLWLTLFAWGAGLRAGAFLLLTSLLGSLLFWLLVYMEEVSQVRGRRPRG